MEEGRKKNFCCKERKQTGLPGRQRKACYPPKQPQLGTSVERVCARFEVAQRTRQRCEWETSMTTPIRTHQSVLT